MSFTSLKKARKSNFSNLVDEIEKLHSTNKKNNGNGADERLWKLTVDKVGNGSAVIRFLPAPAGEDIPWVRIFDHGFQGPGGWYIENSLTTLGKKDPVSEYNSTLWNSGVESNKDIARKQKRRTSHYANIYVVDDKANPENNGKVFIFKFGKKIFEKVNDAMNPDFDDETAVNPFDLWEGANFKLRARQLEGFRNYDKSEFSAIAPLLDDDGEMEKIWNEEYSLQEFLDPKNFKSYDELKARLDKVLPVKYGETGWSSDSPASSWEDNSPAPPRQSIDAHSMPTAEAEPEVEDESLSYFSKLADEA